MLHIHKELRYKSILCLSVILFYISMVISAFIYPKQNNTMLLIGCAIAILLAAFWSIINYIDLLRINPLYKEYTTIDDFIKSLPSEKEDKIEIKQMMTDYVADQILQGEDKLVATKTIIQQFKTSELKNNQQVFYFHSHRYLLKLGTLLIICSTLAYILNDYLLNTATPILTGMVVTFFSYGLGLYLAYLMYQILNKILIKATLN